MLVTKRNIGRELVDNDASLTQTLPRIITVFSVVLQGIRVRGAISSHILIFLNLWQITQTPPRAVAVFSVVLQAKVILRIRMFIKN